MKKTVLIVITMFTFAIFARAEEPIGFIAAGGEDLGSVMVDDEEENFTLTLNDYGQETAVIKGPEIESSQAHSVVDLLSAVPGVYFNEAGTLNTLTGVFAPAVFKIRGFGDTPNSGILALVDGRPQSNGFFRHTLFDTLVLDMVESIEVIKGPAGVLYGNQATAGVINITTKRMEIEGSSYTFGTMLGNYFTQDHFFEALYKKEEIDVNATVNYSSTGGARHNSDSYDEGVHGHVGYELDKDVYACVNGDYSYIRDFNPGPTTALYWPRWAEATQSFHRDGDFKVQYKYSDYNGSFMLYTDSGDTRFLQNAVPLTDSTYSFIQGSYVKYENYGAKDANEWIIFPGNSTKAGIDWQYTSGYFENFPDNPDVKMTAIRYENDYAPYASFSQSVGIFGISGGYRYAFNNRWGNEGIPQFGFKLSLFDQHTIYVNITKGYRTPAAGTVIWADYDSLKPESFWQYELGVNHTVLENFTYNISLYQIEGSNLLQLDTSDNTLHNSGFVLFRGVDADINFKFLEMYTAGASATYLDPREKTSRIARISGKAYLKADITKTLQAKLEGNFARDRYDADFSRGKLGDYFTVNAGVSCGLKIFDYDTKVYLDIGNMFDNKYEVKKGYPVPGFLIKGGGTIKF